MDELPEDLYRDNEMRVTEAQRATFNERIKRREMGLTYPHIHMRYKVWVDDMAGTRGNKFSPFLNMGIRHASSQQ